MLHQFIFHSFHEKTLFPKIKRLNECVKSYNIRNPIELFVENPIKLLVYLVMIVNKWHSLKLGHETRDL